MKSILQLFLKLHIWLYRVSGGKVAGFVSGLPVLLLTSTGAKSGQLRTTPLGYFAHDGGYIIVASNAGFSTHPAWYHNLKATPQAQVEIGAEKIAVTAEVLNDADRAQLWPSLLATAPAYKAYEQKTTRQIPLVLLRPAK